MVNPKQSTWVLETNCPVSALQGVTRDGFRTEMHFFIKNNKACGTDEPPDGHRRGPFCYADEKAINQADTDDHHLCPALPLPRTVLAIRAGRLWAVGVTSVVRPLAADKTGTHLCCLTAKRPHAHNSTANAHVGLFTRNI